MSITRVKVHEYLGMTLDFRTPGELWVNMVNCLKGMLEGLPEVITGISTILAANHLFKVRHEDEQALLDKDRATVFHHMVAHPPFVASRARKDINMVISFLCNLVIISYKDDWVNIVRVLRYIRDTLYMPIIIKWWVGVSFTAHPD